MRVNDSIVANVMLAYFYLNNNDLSVARNLVKNYYSGDSVFSFSQMQIWECNEYFNINSRILFSQKKYSALSKFIREESTHGGVIEIKNQSDIKNYIKSLYLIYFKGELTERFEKFYKKNFLSILPEPSTSRKSVYFTKTG